MKKIFTNNRQKLLDELLDDSIAIIPPNPPILTNGDDGLEYVPNTYLYYLSGIQQEESVLILIKKKKETRTILYLKPRNAQEERWNGKLLTPEAATAISGVEEVFTIDNLGKEINDLIISVSNIYFPLNEHPRIHTTSPLLKAFGARPVRDYASQIIFSLKSNFPLHRYHRLAPIIDTFRTIKQKKEVELIKQAIDITNIGLKSVLKQLPHLKNEQDIEAILHYEFIKQGAKFGFPPIVAGGLNGCTLHYLNNNAPLPADSLVLLDIGAKKNAYSADITRCYPTSGTYPKRIRQVYHAVLTVLKQASLIPQVGIDFQEYTKQVTELMGEQLHHLGLLSTQQAKDPQAIKKYFPHGVSHFLGLVIHDVGNYRQDFKAGMVFTCEPGIYIPEEKIGIRLENDLHLTDEGCKNLSDNILIEPEEIEDLIHSSS